MKKIIILLILVSQIIFAQKKIVIIDGLNHKPIEYCNIDFNNNNGTFSDENGVFYLDQFVEEITVSHISYKPLNVNNFNNIDTLKLVPNDIRLNEVLLRKNNYKEIIVRHNKSKTIFNWPFFPKTEYILFLKPNNYDVESMIKSLIFSINVNVKSKEFKDSYVTIYIFRNIIYNKNREIIYSKIEEVSLQRLKSNNLKFEIDQPIIFNNNGLYFGIQLIGLKEKDQLLNFIDNKNGISLKFVKTKEQDNSFLKNIFYKNGEWNLFSKDNKIFQFDFVKSNINIDLQLILIK